MAGNPQEQVRPPHANGVNGESEGCRPPPSGTLENPAPRIPRPKAGARSAGSGSLPGEISDPPPCALVGVPNPERLKHPMIVTGNLHNIHTMSHEMLHMLLDDVHPDATTGMHNEDFKIKRRLWSGGPNEGDVTDRVRLSKNNNNQMVPDLQKSSYAKP
jgi:hypothetical protein